MSDQENKSGFIDGGSSEGIVEQESNRNRAHSQAELPEEHQLRSRGRVPSVTEEIKLISEDAVIIDIKDRKDVDYVPSEKMKHNLAKNLSSTIKRRDSPEAVKNIKSPESILLAPVEVERKGTSSPQPIPSDVKTLTTDPIKQPKMAAMGNKHNLDGDKITEDTEIRNPEVPNKHSEWSDDEEAGGLPRSDSRASRVSRAVRQLFCCGVPYEAPSEEDLSTSRGYATGI